MQRKSVCFIGKKNQKKRWKHIWNLMLAVILFSFASCMPVFAAGMDAAAIINSGFDPIYEIIAAIVSAIGQLYLLWGLFEWAQSLNTQDGGAQSMAFKRVASGLVAVLGPQLVPIITAAISTASA